MIIVFRILLVFFISTVTLTAQVKTLRFLDGHTKRPVYDADVYTDSTFVTTTGYNGNVKVDIGGEYSNVVVSHISYEDKVIPRDSLQKRKVYKLKRRIGFLDEVIIDSKQLKDSMSPVLLNFAWNSKVATFIPYRSDSIITKLKFRVINVKGVKGLNYLSFKTNLYSFDTVRKTPKEPLLPEDLVVENKEGNKWATIDVSKYNIRTPKEGLCIVFIISGHKFYKVTSIMGKGGAIPAVPTLKHEGGVRRKGYSYIYKPEYKNGDRSGYRWVTVKRRRYKMELELEGED
ncbi:MAG: hypothetical protein BM557_03730 [Flavobacterium sp. MedPE-SWcel]|uniref:hypothetical protein n=1 Tax=uncultured Flavobacterium sp. TaxID=165435 RepID=UPI00091BE2C2|nr:hypothetical protein [uncultured Flavobacterium sp.]OIQ21371.1 MAG: hypothetical protein BM557_03730 [Flavobacterium sp. MedPE-SWcel]